MAFNTNLPLSLRDQVRLEVADIDPDYPIFGDEIYDHYLTKNSDNVRRSALEVARVMLFYLTRYTRERTGAIEVYGAEWATNFRKALELFLKNPDLSVINAMPYAGGISKEDFIANIENPDVLQAWRGGCKCTMQEIITSDTFTY